MQAASRVSELAASIRAFIVDGHQTMPKKPAPAERTTIKIEREAASKIRQIAWIEQVSAVELYSRILTEWANGYEASLGKKIEDVMPGHVSSKTKEGKTVAALRAPKPVD
jgi:hypothetical protein